MESKEDIFLLKLIQEDDKKAFRYLFDTFFAPLCRFVRLYVGEHTLAEEIALDVFTAVWEKKHTIEIKHSWKAYLFQAARNKALNHIRESERFVAVSDWSWYKKAETDYAVELKELERFIEEAVYALPGLCGDVFRKSRLEYLSNKEIAERLNISVKYVEAQITKALKLLRKHLGDL
ncbi:MAG: RNA polymerase sigma-70 factor [Tannerellaceae bacterium]|jgi:RNA polymerase sigma-70 factor (ECF subfamily)|nr:RNA polymerase sigma-70 factor [Tannerellaceae bacterium]